MHKKESCIFYSALHAELLIEDLGRKKIGGMSHHSALILRRAAPVVVLSNLGSRFRVCGTYFHLTSAS